MSKSNHNYMLAKMLLFMLAIFFSATITAQTILVETETFQNKGGWVLDQQFMLEMGSPYLLAHGLGKPVADASTNVKLPSTGKYRVWVRTKDWVAQWNAKGEPGKFQISINNQKLDTIFGTKYATWSWQNGGVINITNSDVTLKLIDLTGFEGRCDAIVFTKDPDFIPPYEATTLATWRKTMLGNATVKNAGNYDLVVVGGGIAGTTAAIGAARLGLKVALVQDRAVVGGNNSSEVRVGLGGSINVAPYNRIGNIVKELTYVPNPNIVPGSDSTFNDSKRMDILKAEKNITLLMNYRADGVTVSNQMIKSVIAENTITAERIEVFGTYFSDCTGDGTIGYLAGADYEMDVTKHMGNTNMWTLKQETTPQPFPTLTWALDLSTKPFPGRPGISGSYNTSGISALGGWYWESGFSHNPITEVEYIRDYNFRAMYGAWDCVKNVDKIYPNYKLNWAAYITGKRESRMLLGDVQLNIEVLLANTMYPDGFVAIGWNMDVHVPRPNFQASFEGEEFISIDIQTSFKRPFYVPYRCLYSRNINNLFMAGRNISVTQAALGTVRVMRTTGMMGEVVGLAAGLCKKRNVMPRKLYENYLTELKTYISAGIPAAGDTIILTKPVVGEPDPKNPQIIVDNTDSTCTFDNSWPISVYSLGYVGTNYTQDGSPAADTAKWAKWTPNIPATALYRVYMNWTDGSNRPAKAPVEILCADSTAHFTINQQTNGSTWNLLGTYRFKAGREGYVKLSASGTGATIADAVLFENISAPTAIAKTYTNESNINVFNSNTNTMVALNLAKNSRVSIAIYSLYGSEVQSIVNEQNLTADRYFYKIKNEKLNKGIYIIRLVLDGKVAECKKIVVN